MSVTLFVLSDIHGHYREMINALDAAGFDPQNPKHELLALGDYFDRGTQNTAVYEYLKSLMERGKAEGLLGNHDCFMLEFLQGNDHKTLFNVQYNGFGQTLEDFSAMPYSPSQHSAIRHAILSHYPGLLAWCEQRPLFIEHEGYVFAHGGVNGKDPNWRNQPRETFVWNYQTTLAPLKDKTVVVGHERTPQIRMKRGIMHGISLEDPRASQPIHDEHVIYIDPFVEATKRMNVVTFTLKHSLVRGGVSSNKSRTQTL